MRSSKQQNKTKGPKRNKNFNQNRSAYTARNQLSGNALIVPDVYRTKIAFHSRVNMGGSAGVIVQKYRGNDLYDPDVSGVGGQPEGFDQLMALYERFRVLGSAIKAEFVSVGTSAGTQSFECAVIPTATGVSFTTMEDVTSAPYCRWRVNQGLSNPNPSILHQMQTGKIEGVPQSKVRDEDSYSGTAALSATSGFDWQLLTQCVDRATNLNCYVYVTITYDTEFYSRVNLALSATRKSVSKPAIPRPAKISLATSGLTPSCGCVHSA